MNTEQFDGAIEHLSGELRKLRTNRANPALLEGLQVDYYDQKMAVNQLASISVPEARQLLIQPWDKNALQPLELAIRNSDLGVNPVNEGDKLRITLPELNQERRQDLVKLMNKIVEEARVRVRAAREELWKDIQKKESSGEISEDDKFKQKDDLQKVVDKYNDEIKSLAEQKEKEIMTI